MRTPSRATVSRGAGAAARGAGHPAAAARARNCHAAASLHIFEALGQSWSCRVTVMPSHRHAESRSCRITVTLSHVHAESRSCRVTVMPSHGHAKSRSCRVTVTGMPSHGDAESPSYRVTVMPSPGHAESPSCRFSVMPSHRHAESRSRSCRVTVISHGHAESRSRSCRVTVMPSHGHAGSRSCRVTVMPPPAARGRRQQPGPRYRCAPKQIPGKSWHLRRIPRQVSVVGWQQAGLREAARLCHCTNVCPDPGLSRGFPPKSGPGHSPVTVLSRSEHAGRMRAPATPRAAPHFRRSRCRCSHSPGGGDPRVMIRSR